MSAETFWPIAAIVVVIASLLRGVHATRGIVRAEVRAELMIAYLASGLLGLVVALAVWGVLCWTLQTVAPYGRGL